MEFIKSIDVFGQEFYFTIFGKSKYNTMFGGMLTILVFIFTCLITILFGVDLITRTNPKVMVERVIPKSYTYTNCSIQNFPFFWRFSDDNIQTIDITNILFPQLSFFVYKYNNISNQYDLLYNKFLSTKLCTKELVKDDQMFQQYGLKNYYCIDWLEAGYPLGGYWDSGDWVYYFEKVIYSCPNDEKNSTNCTKVETLKNFLGSSNKIN